MDLDAVADELYALAPGQFTPRRDALVKQARADGDRTTAAEIAALRKPTVVAWLANQLVRHHPEEVAPLLGLGQALREATLTLSGPELRSLSAQRQQLVHALVTRARVLGQDAGQRVTEDAARSLEDTFHAVLADPAAAQALAAGRLVAGLSHQGYGNPLAGDASSTASPDVLGGRPAPARPSKPTARQKQRARERSEVEHDLGEAWGQARRAADARDTAAAAAELAQRERAEAERKATRLRAELEAAETELAAAARQDDAARASRDATDHEAQTARQHVAELQRRLDGLQEP